MMHRVLFHDGAWWDCEQPSTSPRVLSPLPRAAIYIEPTAEGAVRVVEEMGSRHRSWVEVRDQAAAAAIIAKLTNAHHRHSLERNSYACVFSFEGAFPALAALLAAHP